MTSTISISTMRKPIAGNPPVSLGYGVRYGSDVQGEGWSYAGQIHRGIDYAVSVGTPVRAAQSGRVIFAGEDKTGYGLMVKIDHGAGMETIYAHLSQVQTRVGKIAIIGEVIAISGQSGTVTGPHLHFEVRKDGKAVDPESYLVPDTAATPVTIDVKSAQPLSVEIKQPVTASLRCDRARIACAAAYIRPAPGDAQALGILYSGTEIELDETTEPVSANGLTWCRAQVTAWIAEMDPAGVVILEPVKEVRGDDADTVS